MEDFFSIKQDGVNKRSTEINPKSFHKKYYTCLNFDKIREMRKILLILLLIGLGWVVVRFGLGGSEDSWICEKGEWIKHGVPRSSKPERKCEN